MNCQIEAWETYAFVVFIFVYGKKNWISFFSHEAFSKMKLNNALPVLPQMECKMNAMIGAPILEE